MPRFKVKSSGIFSISINVLKSNIFYIHDFILFV